MWPETPRCEKTGGGADHPVASLSPVFAASLNNIAGTHAPATNTPHGVSALLIRISPPKLGGLARQRRDKLRLRIPGEEYPGILADLGDERIHRRPAVRLGVNRPQMRLGE